jgi:hypothetical protein
MEYVIKLLRYDLECLCEDLSSSEIKLNISVKNKIEDNIKFYSEEIKILSTNIEQVKKAIKILTDKK